MKQSHYILLTLAVAMLGSVMIFDNWLREDPQHALDNAFDSIQELYAQDSTVIGAYTLDEAMPFINDSPFDIHIHSVADSLIYWNKSYAKRDTNYAPHWKKSFISRNGKVTFTLDLFKKSKLDLTNVLPRSQLPQYSYYYSKSGNVELPSDRKRIKLGLLHSTVEHVLHSLFVIIWLLGQILLGVFLVLCYKMPMFFGRSNWNILLYWTTVLLLWIGLGYLGTNYFFGGHIYAKAGLGKGKHLNLLTFINGLLYLYLLIEGMNRSKVRQGWKRINNILAFTISSIALNSLLFGLVYIIEKFILDDVVRINIEEVLRLDHKSFVFILALMGYCIVFYFGCSILYSSKQANSKIWERVLGHGMGLIAVAYGLLTLGMLTPVLPVVLFVLAYFLVFDVYEDFKIRNLTYLIVNIILFGGFLSVVIFYAGLQKDKIERKVEMKSVFSLLENDMQQKAIEIRDSIVASKLVPSIASLVYPSPMDHDELVTYINKIKDTADPQHNFEMTGVECYDSDGNSLFFNHISNFSANSQLIRFSDKVGPNVYHLPLNALTSIFLKIENEEFPSSPLQLIIKLSPKRSANQPTLEDKNYLIYKDNQLIYSFSNDYIDINNIDPSGLTQDLEIGEMSYVVYAPDAKYKIIDYHEVAGWIKPISFFSMIFVIAGILIVFLTTLNSKWSFLPKSLDFRFYNQSSLRSKIQLSVIFLIVFSFVIIGITTTVYFNNIVKKNDQSKFKAELKTIVNDVNNKLTETLDPESASNIIAKEFSEIENVYNRRFAYYGADGKLQLKSELFDNTYFRIPYEVLMQIQSESRNSLKTVSHELSENEVLIPVYLSNATPVGYFTMNYNSRRTISNGIYNHLGNLLNVYIFLFFIAGAISIFIANSITEPLSRLREGVKRFKLGSSNEKLQYESNDELGILIQEYNDMTEKLEDSAKIIAKTERDMAWREMAKQVAHEIKNPLTPMKLHIQHLQNTASTDAERAQQMIKKVSGTLIEQINNLSNIASEFSNYATLPKAENNRTELNEVVEHVHDLFRQRDDMDIQMNEPIEDLVVFADRNHLVRVFVNIIKNAVQSIPQGRRGLIEIDLSREKNMAQVRIKDNGSGIPDHMKDKIFTPNFTTKSSGTGLGLAICVNMLETMNGYITFTSTEGVGTEFLIEIPIMGNANGNQVFLDD